MSPDICSICNSPRSIGVGPCSVCGAPPSTSARNLPAGTHLQNGQFTLGRVLGEGGFGITYLGAHRYLKRTVAIKELFPESAMRQGTTVSVPESQQRDFHMGKERVLEEARVISRLDSPYIVGVYDAFLENNTAYIVMEYLEGRSLQERIEAEGPLPLDDVRRIAMAVCDALTEVHRQDLLHRDIKPANIMLTRDGRVVLVDFGSARAFARGQTVRHTRILTRDYAAPEMYSTQARFGPYTDLFCLGGTLFHALTGRHPPSVMDRLQGGSVNLEFPEILQGPMSTAIRQALQIAIEDRPPSAEDFKAACAKSSVPDVMNETDNLAGLVLQGLTALENGLSSLLLTSEDQSRPDEDRTVRLQAIILEIDSYYGHASRTFLLAHWALQLHLLLQTRACEPTLETMLCDLERLRELAEFFSLRDVADEIQGLADRLAAGSGGITPFASVSGGFANLQDLTTVTLQAIYERMEVLGGATFREAVATEVELLETLASEELVGRYILDASQDRMRCCICLATMVMVIRELLRMGETGSTTAETADAQRLAQLGELVGITPVNARRSPQVQ